jgi:hypothetical protein
MERKYRYLGYIMLLLIPLTFFGFYKTYFEHFPSINTKVDVFAHLHAFISVLWLSMLIVQPILISKKKIAAHRLTGKLSYIVFTLLILSFIPQTLKTFQTGLYKNLFFPIADTILLVSFYALAMLNKKNVAKHMRYIIAGALVFFGPTLGRMGPLLFGWTDLQTQNIQYATIYSILIGLFWYDGKSFKQSPVYIIAIGIFLIHQLTYYLLFV